MNILLVGGDAKSQAESFNALRLAFGDEAAIETATSFSAVRRELQGSHYHVILDLGLSEEVRWRLPRLARQLNPLAQVIMVFESGQEGLITDALRQGASEALVHSNMYPSLLPFITERAYERYTLLEQHRRASRQTFDPQALDEFTHAVAQALDLGKALNQARTALHEIDTLLEKSREELLKRRVMLREAGSEVQRRERGLKALSDLAETVSRSPDLESILVNILDQALAMTTAEAGAILVIEDESKPLRLAAQKRLSDELIAALSGRWPDVSALMSFLISGQVLLVQNVAQSDAPPELLTLLSREGFTSMIGVPLRVGGNLLGQLVIATRHAGKLTKRDARWLGVMGQQAGIAIENTRLRTEIWEAAEAWFHQPALPSPASPKTSEETESEMKRLAQALDKAKRRLHRREDALASIINVIGTASYRPDMPAILQETLHHILEESETGGIWLLDESSETLTLTAQAELPEDLARSWSRQEWAQDDLLTSLMSGELVYLDDLSSEPGDSLMGLLAVAGLRVVVGIPLQVQGQSVGAMVIMARKRGQLQVHDAELLTAVGQQLSQALERQQLYDRIRRLALELAVLRGQQKEPQTEMLTALQQMADQVQHREEQFAAQRQVLQFLAQDREQVLKAGLTGALNTLDANGGLVLQRDPVHGHLTMVHQVGLPDTFVDKWALRPIDIQESLAPAQLKDLHTIVLTATTVEQPAIMADLLAENCIQALVVTPLSLQRQADGLLGVLVLVFSDYKKSPLPLTENDSQWLDLLAQTMALSITSIGQAEVADKAKARRPQDLKKSQTGATR